jgi:outer membrane receptor protein involved in Fe transport
VKARTLLIQSLFSGAALTLLSGAPGYAQDAAKPANQTALPDIIVTAQRRSERLQDVPISVTSVNATALAETRVFNVENISSISPSITYRDSNIPSSSGNIQIRGIGTTGIARAFEGSVGVFVDGVYRTRSGEALSEFLDIDNLQILRGPQGTLFGKNTSAGAVLLTTASPSTGAVSGNYEAGFGNYDEYRVKGAVNIPLSDEVAVRFSALETDHDGYIKDVNGGTDNHTKQDAVKAQLLYKPNDDFKLRFIADYSKSSGNCCFGTVQTIVGPVTQYFVDPLVLANGKKLPSTKPSDYQAGIGSPTPTNVEDFGGTLLIDDKLGSGVLHSVTGVRKYHVTQQEDATFSGADILQVYETFTSQFLSQELSYNGQINGPVNADYVVGGFISDEKIDIDRSAHHGSQAQSFWTGYLNTVFEQFVGIPDPFPIDAARGELYAETLHGTAQSYALYGHINFKLSDQWNVILGLRGTEDRKTGGEDLDYYRDRVYDPLAYLGDVPIPYRAKTTDDALTGTFGLEYHANRQTMIYATYNRGYKAGGVNLDSQAAGLSAGFLTPAIPSNPVYSPETTDAFEGGFKIDWLDFRARTNAAVFYDKIANLQVAQFVGLRFTVLNAPTATVYGAEFEQTFKLTHELTLTAAGTYLPEATFGDSTLLGAPLSGRRFATAPTFAGQVALAGQHPITDDLAVTGRLQVEYTTKVYTNTADDETQNAFALINANLGVMSLSKHWTVEVWAQNLADVHYFTQHFQTPIQSGSTNAYVGDPRTFGVTLRGTF